MPKNHLKLLWRNIREQMVGVYLVPKEFQVKGRSAVMHNVNICRTHNVQAHANASMVTDGKEDTKEALSEEIIRQAEAIGITV